jgi:hypothetical protein
MTVYRFECNSQINVHFPNLWTRRDSDSDHPSVRAHKPKKSTSDFAMRQKGLQPCSKLKMTQRSHWVAVNFTITTRKPAIALDPR